MTGTQIIELLKGVSTTSLWGLAISKVVEMPDAPKVVELVIELRSQARDQPEVMRDILGNDCFKAIMSI